MKPAATIASLFLQRAAVTSRKAAFITSSHSTSFSDASDRITAIARGLLELGVECGARVTLVARNAPNIACAYLAIHSIGGIVVVVDERTPIVEMERLRALTDSKIVITDRADLIRGIAVPVVDVEALVGMGAEKRSGAEIPFQIRNNLEDIADILFTSGSTGAPKGVVLSHRNVLASATQINSVIGQGAEDIEIVAVPLGHSFGLGRLRCAAMAGNALILEPELRDPLRALQRLLQTKASGLALVPAGFEIIRRLTRGRLGEAAGHLKYIEIGSSPIHPEIRSWLTRLLPHTRIYHHYGMTEASRAIFTEYHRDAKHKDSVGLPAPGVDIQILDPSGRVLPPREQGEIAIRGDMVMVGYLNEVGLPRRGPFRSGDLGWHDEAGYVYLSGRLKDVINVGGLKVMPPEVERIFGEALKDAPINVLDFAVAGIPDEDGVTGEKVALAYIADAVLQSATLKKLFERRIEAHKIPTRFVRVHAIPRGPTGKVMRPRLAEILCAKVDNGP